MSDVIPFDPNRRRKGRPPAPPDGGNEWLSPQSRKADPRAQTLASQQNLDGHHRYLNALERQRHDREKTALPVPARISMALDMGGHEGPEVDLAVGTFEGNPAGDVDLWECGLASPDEEQVRLLAELTGFPVEWFHKQMEPGPLVGRMTICWTDSRGCQSPEPDLIDDKGVLHYGGEQRQPPEWWTNGQPALF